MEQTADRSQFRFLDQICSDLLRCQKVISIYPLEHPRVRATLEDLRLAIARQAERIDDLVSMDTLLVEDLANREPERLQSGDNYASLARLLKLHLIQEVRFRKDVSLEELYEFSCLLQEDFLEAPAERLDRFDPCSWTSIELWFYTPQDFPDDLDAGETLLGRAAGLRRSKEIEQLLKTVPPSVATSIRRTLVKPVCLRKLSELRRRMHGASRRDADDDLVASLVKHILERIGGATTTSVDEILMIVDEYIRAAQMSAAQMDTAQMDTAEKTVAGERARGDEPVARDESSDHIPLLLRALSRDRATEKVTDLRDLFGDGPAADDVTRKLPEEPSADDSEPLAPPVRKTVRRQPKNESEDPLHDLFEGVDFDVVAWRESLTQRDQLLRYLRVILELLLDGSSQNVVSRNSSAVLGPLTNEMNDRGFMREVVREIVEFSTSAGVAAVDEVLSMLLEAVESTALVYSILEDHVIPESHELSLRTLDRLAERKPRRALELLMRLHQHPAPEIHGHAENTLISLARSPALLEAWAREYPGGLVDPRVFSRIVERESPERLIEAFKDFFTHTPPECSLRLLRLISADLIGVDYILFAAIQHGPPEVHDYALDFLDQSCIPVVTGTLIQTVRLNNYQERPSMKEVATALDALCRMDEPRAREFIHDVETSRSGWLRYEYRREIREALKGIRERLGRN